MVKLKVEALTGVANDSQLEIKGSYNGSGDECGKYGQVDLLKGTFVPSGTTPAMTQTSGPYDAWDIFRGDTDGDGKIDDINISSKIAGKSFDLTLGLLDEKGIKANKDSTIYYGLYSGSYLIDGSTGSFRGDSKSTTATFTVSDVYRTVKAGFKFCAKGHTDDKTGSFIYEVAKDSDCKKSELLECLTDTGAEARWNLCFNTDAFTVRPDRFKIELPVAEESELLRSAQEYNLTVTALDAAGNRSADYNQTKGSLTLEQKLILRNGSYDDSKLLRGELEFSADDFNISEGITLAEGRNDVMGVKFSDVGKVEVKLLDKRWASVDNDDTPQECTGGIFSNGKADLTVPEGTYLCGDINLTFIPDHFAITGATLHNHRDGGYTYLSYQDDLRMSTHIGLTIEAKNRDDNITTNFKRGSLYYENPLSVRLKAPLITAEGHSVGLTPVIRDIDTPMMLEFGGVDANGTVHIAWNDSNSSQRLMFNYNKDIQNPVNPFDINGTQVDINASSLYTSTSGKQATVTGTGQAGGTASYYYAKAKSSKYLYDDVTESSIVTPISIVVYQNPGSSSYALDYSLFRPSNDYEWYISTTHDSSQNDGDITLEAKSGGSVSPADPNTLGISGGLSDNATASKTAAGTAAQDVKITFGPDTSPWLLFDREKNTLASGEFTFYHVRFIGSGNWAGYGQTGHVVDSNASKTKNRRIGW